MTGEQKGQVVNSWLSGEPIANVATFHALNKLHVEKVLREAFVSLLKQLQASESKAAGNGQRAMPPMPPEHVAEIEALREQLAAARHTIGGCLDVLSERTVNGEPLPTKVYPCGCQASGTFPLPEDCPEHGSPEKAI